MLKSNEAAISHDCCGLGQFSEEIVVVVESFCVRQKQALVVLAKGFDRPTESVYSMGTDGTDIKKVWNLSRIQGIECCAARGDVSRVWNEKELVQVGQRCSIKK
jgi:hypothetical protein